MSTISTLDPRAVAVTRAIHVGDVEGLRRLLEDDPGLAVVRLGDDDPGGMSRPLLHVATDWPGHFPRVAETIAVLVAAGADVDARFRGPHEETALHWAASSDDVEALHALLDAGADIEADGAVIAGGTPLTDATAFGQWGAARALVARGARAGLFDLAALGMTSELLSALESSGRAGDEVDHAFWSACHGNRLDTAQALVELGADVDWLPPWEDATPLDIAARVGAHDVVRWLHGLGARSCEDLGQP
ncbi:ankyrin repeat domain-containing protein [Nocardioides oleivorans]|uniref:Ankyrin repeat domain-containing protein n=1 Tax=Nocardioides oleivorans TaxID=273676 RepID=A0A4Q2S3L9_9ACTN|nr:ankyrin repeat domain-containing protein [Nocardioides oleivorans]RYB94949.1 ankyrin repeat domain-containing protein [Nocardioides oleivorans]